MLTKSSDARKKFLVSENKENFFRFPSSAKVLNNEMAWNLCFHPGVKKDLRRISSEARNSLLERIFPLLKEKPYCGEPLHGPLRGFWKYRTGKYRITYSVNKELREIIVIEIGPRGGFYERLRRRLRF